MKTYKLSSGYKMPLFGLGTSKAEKEDELYKAVREAVNIGYRHIDCAKIYENEHVIGKALNDAFKANDVKREEMFITSKLWNDSHATDDVIPALKSTLQDLKLDYLDLYLIHWPVCHKKGIVSPADASEYISIEKLPISETWIGMEKAEEEKLVKSVGVSNFSIKKLKELDKTAGIKPVVNQVECHPFLQQKELLDYGNSKNIALTAFSPLGARDRTGCFLVKDEPSLLDNSVINKIAQKHNASPAQVLIKWQIGRNVVVIPKSVNPKRLKENFEAQFIELDEIDLKEISTLDRHFRFMNGTFFNFAGTDYSLETLWDE